MNWIKEGEPKPQIDIDLVGNTTFPTHFYTTSELFKVITSEFKWYKPKSEQWAYSIKRRFAKGQIKQSTLIALFAKFGYEQNEITWKKK